MGEKMLRFVVNEVNKMLKTDYNMISFDSLAKNALIQVCVDCLQKLNALPKLNVEKKTEESLAKLLEIVTDIKVPPPPGVNINDFTEGIAQGKRNIIHPLLHWVLSNQEEVKKRAYFAKYLKKVSLPLAISSEPDIQQLLAQYDYLIQEFKAIHAKNTKFFKMGRATQDYRKNIDKLNNDITKINQQIERQKGKFQYIPNKESLYVSIKAYRSEVQQEKTLDKQLEEQNAIVNQLDNQIKTANERLKQQKGLRLAPGGPLGQLQEEVQTLNIIVHDRLPQELETLKNELHLVESVATGPPPTNSEIADLQAKVDKTSLEVQKMLEQTLLKNDPRDDKLAQFRQHATVIANNKQLAADALIELKEELNVIRQQVEEKEAELHRIVGGTMPQGEELKRFVSRIRSRSVIYKEQRAQLLEIQAEIGVLTRTQDILLQQDSTLSDALQNREINEDSNEEYIAPENVSELTKACKDLIKQINTNKADIALAQQELQHLKTECEELSRKHQQSKEVYESSMSNISVEVEKLQIEFLEKEKLVDTEEKKWKKIRRQTEKKEELLNKLKADVYYYGDEKKNQTDILVGNLRHQEMLKKELEGELQELMEDKEEREQQVILWHATLELLKSKKDYISKKISA